MSLLVLDAIVRTNQLLYSIVVASFTDYVLYTVLFTSRGQPLETPLLRHGSYMRDSFSFYESKRLFFFDTTERLLLC